MVKKNPGKKRTHNEGTVFETLEQSCIADKQSNQEQNPWKARLLFKSFHYSYLQGSILLHLIGAGLWLCLIAWWVVQA